MDFSILAKLMERLGELKMPREEIEEGEGESVGPEAVESASIEKSAQAPEQVVEEKEAKEFTSVAEEVSGEKESKRLLRYCPHCGVEVEPDAKYCTRCATLLEEPQEKGFDKKRVEVPKAPVRPWAMKAGNRVGRMSRKAKIGIPVTLFLIIAVVVTLFVLAAIHSPSSTLERYLSLIKQGRYELAHDLIAESGRFTELDYFTKWQRFQADELGPLREYRITPGGEKSEFLGKYLDSGEEEKNRYTATLIFADASYDAGFEVEDAGGFWPIKRYRLRLGSGNSRVIASMGGAEVYIDGVYAGEVEENSFFRNAKLLKELPDSPAESVDYAKKITQTITGLASEIENLVQSVDDIALDVQRIVDKFGSTGVSWAEVVDASGEILSSGKGFWTDISRFAMGFYWLFGGGDDGSLRSELSHSVQTYDFKDLPDGYHKITVKAPGAKEENLDFIAPDHLFIELKPSQKTRESLLAAMNSYYAIVASSLANASGGALPIILGGGLLEEVLQDVGNRALEGRQTITDLRKLDYEKIELLAPEVATVETVEVWNINELQAGALVSAQNDVKRRKVYTLRLEGDEWKVVERKEI